MFDAAMICRLRTLALRARQLKAIGWTGEAISTGEEQGVTCVGLREYAPGDDPRDVDWRWCARRDELLTRVFRADVGRQAWIVLDCSKSMAGDGSKFDVARRAAALLAYAAVESQHAACLVAVGREPVELPPLRASRGFPAWGRGLQRLSAESCRADLSAVAGALGRHGGRRGPVAVISDFYGGHDVGPLLDQLLSRGYRPWLVQVYDAAESVAPRLGDVQLVDVETGATRHTVITERTAANYRAAFARFLQSVAAACRRRYVPCHQVRTDARLDDLLPALFGIQAPGP